MIQVHAVLGMGRSGTTVAGHILGDAMDAPCLDELHLAWRRGVLEDRPCSCGARFSSCDMWGAVRRAAPEVLTRQADERSAAIVERLAHPRSSLLACSGRGRRRLRATTPAWFTEAQEALVGAVAGVLGVASLVDTSKAPALVWALGACAGLEVHPWHVVRDPRAVAWSWQHPPELPAAHAALPTTTATRAAVAWLLVNASSDAVSRALGSQRVVRLEDLAADVDAVRAEIRASAPRVREHAPVVHTAKAVTQHSIAGNPGVRLTDASATVRIDERWRSAPRAQQRVVTAIAAPLLRRYDYPWSIR